MDAENSIAPNANFSGFRIRLAAAFLMFVTVFFECQSPANAQSVVTYSNTTTAVINDVTCGTAGIVTRTFVVPQNFIIADVDLGVLLSHTYRSDLRITLASPAGTTINIMVNTAGSGDNLNDRFDDEAATSITTHNGTVTDPVTPAPPPYSHSFQTQSLLSAFDGQNASGTWTMVICDSVAQDVGTFTRADLFLTTAPANIVVTKSSSIVSDGVSVSNPKAIPNATTRYCINITNNGPSLATLVSAADTIPSMLTYVAGSMRSGATCATAATVEDDDAAGADETDPYGASITGSTVSIGSASLSSGTSFAVTFNATVN